jgi:hypothetical protein
MGYRRRGDEFHFFLAAKNNKNIREIYLILEKLAIIAIIAIIAKQLEIKYITTCTLYSSPDQKGHVSYCHH